MCPCDLLLAGTTDHSMEVNCKEKISFLLVFIRTSSPFSFKLQNDTVMLFEQRGVKKKQGGAPPCLLSAGKL